MIGLVGSSTFAQLCPASVDGNRLDKPANFSSDYNFNETTCKPDAFGGTQCHIICTYIFPNHLQTGIPVSHFRLFASWQIKPQERLQIYHSDSCKEIPAPRHYINSSSKVAVVEFHGAGAVNSGGYLLGKKAAQQLLTQLENSAISCPNSSNPNNSDNNNKTTICRQNSEKLVKLEAKSSEIDFVLRYLENYQVREEQFRVLLSSYNKIIAALNTPNYNGEYKEEINRLRTDEFYRKSVVMKIGLPAETDPLVAFRTIRDLTVARIEYLKDGLSKTTKANDEKIFNDAEIVKLRLQMTQAQCGGRFDVNSCNLSGEWTFFSDDQEEIWKFSPSTVGKYEAVNQTTGAKGTAEVYEKEVILRWAVLENSGSYKLKLAEFCQNGNGEKRFSGSDKQIIFTAYRKNTTRVFVTDNPYILLYQGKVYHAIYEQQQYEGTPIDVFFFKILATNGSQVEQNGAKLWGRFVRLPATTHSDQSNVVWSIANWKLDGEKWVKDNKQGIIVEVKN